MKILAAAVLVAIIIGLLIKHDTDRWSGSC